ncbi:SixA phosphatase family protein [Pedobacter insulae]|uniref:Phosphohistidine phosphatase n=1 Tax=Pedobacter insulae TaxID=414048 RepID=A0A1I2YI44_9SPHI|nr:histidine phosphatase family protein [Pedobacter insulae]SFH25333.1 phosphohistidine phosphatase [Pedobacter insulae]
MAKRLLLIRHAKSDWADPALKDFDRPLNKRGNANAPEMAQRLVDCKIFPELIVASPALRALTTARYFAEAWGLPTIHTNKSIYEASLKTLLDMVNEFDDSLETIAMFGHNPGFTDFANYLSDAAIYNMPTCSVVMLEFPVDNWEMVSAQTAKVLLFDYPKSLAD